jgi:putative membrane protein
LERIHTAAVFLLIAIALFVLRSQAFLARTPFGNVQPYIGLAAIGVLGAFLIVLAVILLITWLIYRNYKFSLGDDALKIKQGVINKTETAIPYRQIQNVDIERDLSIQMFGLSRIVILTAGEEETKPGQDESEGILPALDKDLAEWLQAELLKRANVQKVTEEK